MKKQLFFLMALMGTLGAQAADVTYPYLTFEATDGTKTSVALTSGDVTLDFSGSTLTVGGQTFNVGELSKMYFSADNQTSGIETLGIADAASITAIYDMQGRQVDQNSLRRGFYVIKTQTGTRKVCVK